VENGTQNFESSSAHVAPQDYLNSFVLQKSPRVFEDAIRLLVPSRKHTEICALFGHRVTYSSIRFWRRGKRPPPQWARDLLSAQVAKHLAQIDTMLTQLAQLPVGPGKGVWNARRAAQKAAGASKEKAGD
jgi:hypothetical protein